MYQAAQERHSPILPNPDCQLLFLVSTVLCYEAPVHTHGEEQTTTVNLHEVLSHLDSALNSRLLISFVLRPFQLREDLVSLVRML